MWDQHQRQLLSPSWVLEPLAQLPCRRPPAVADPLSQAERSLFQFNTPADLELWKVFSDSEYGGRSTAELRLCEDAPVSEGGCPMSEGGAA